MLEDLSSIRFRRWTERRYISSTSMTLKACPNQTFKTRIGFILEKG
jgi:hypothetical protein